MKNFITSKWIPMVYAGVFFLSLALLKLANSLTESALVILHLVIFFSMVLLYFPILAVTVVRTKHPKAQNIINNIALFCLALWIIAIPLKLYHMLSAVFVVPTSSIIFFTSFLPAWFVLKNIETQGKFKLFYFLLCTFFASVVLWGWWTFYHYPGAGITPFFVILSTIILLPYLIYLFIKGRIKFNFKDYFVFIFLIAYIVGTRQMSYMRDLRYNSIRTHQDQIEKSLDKNQRKAQFIYEAFDNTNSKDTLFIKYYQKVKSIKAERDTLQKYVDDLRALIVSETANLPLSVADTIRFNDIAIDAKANYDIPTVILFSPDYSSPDAPANKLGNKLQKFSDTLIFFSPEDFRMQFQQFNPIQIEDKDEYEDGMKLTWGMKLFDHRPLGHVYTQLTSIQNDIKSAEIIVLNELFNRANQNRKENIAAQLSELALKYETEKKEKQISLLQKDKELNDTKLLAKDLEISQTRETLIYFVFALVVFVILIVFVIRANVQRRKANQTLSKQKAEIEEQKHIIEEKQHEILDSIKYAKRLQQAILPPQEFIDKHLPNNFVVYKPKDIVAGDFYWAHSIENCFFLAAADSTGHGVPGAMVSVVCSNALNRAVKEFNLTDTGKILDKTRQLVIETFEKSQSEVKDGMDISLLCIDKTEKKIFWSGANNPLWYVQENDLKEIKPDKQPIGKTENPKPFITHEIQYKENTTFYLFTDGYADQFGGENGKKFKYKQFENLLVSISAKSLQEQAQLISQVFENWKGTLEQVDDVSVIGVRI